MKKRPAFPLLCLFGLLLSLSFSCGQMATGDSAGAKLNFPPANYSGLGWLSETRLAAFPADENGGVTGYYLENGDHFYSLDLPPFVAKLDCDGVNDFINDINYAHPSVLPDGRLGLINSCVSGGDPPGLKRQYMVAYNFQTKETNLLVNEPLPSYLSNAFTWNPNMALGLAQIYGGLNGTIYWISPEEVLPVDFAISDGARSFLPARDFPQFLVDSEGQGIVFSPAWSPDGKTIAFFVTLDAIGRRGWSRSDGEYQILFMDPIEQKPYPVVDKIYDGYELAWSPESKWIAFIGKRGILGHYGIWLYSIETRKIFFVVSGRFSEIAWSPDGTKIAATICEPDHPNPLCDRYEVWQYEVGSITGE